MRPNKVGRRLYRQKSRNPDNAAIRVRFKNLRNNVNSVVRRARRAYACRKFESAGSDLRKFWSVLNEIVFGRVLMRRPPVTIELDGQLTSDGVLVAEAMNEFFASSGQSHAQVDMDTAMAHVTSSDAQFRFHPITRDFVEQILSTMNVGASAGLDGVTVKLLRRLPSEVLDKLTYVLKDMFQRSVFPPCLKSARTVPIEKKGDMTKMENYRGIAILPALSKLPEKIMSISIDDHLYDHNLLHSNQFGFTRRSNTLAAVVNLVTHVRQEMDGSRKVTHGSGGKEEWCHTALHWPLQDNKRTSGEPPLPCSGN